ncbi:hypothetical protein JVU11DRAFT_4535 [Chiua virens]|nr:hypothetical protein JVU11DRAFT_4535 [Chiua virens]
MGDSANTHDISVTPRRYLQRQWKRNKPHLSPSDSLPALRLCPNRPLFVCAQCGFANAWIPLCLWCKWTSAEATKQFEANLPRPRRLSAPSRAVPAPKTTGHGQLPRRTSAESKGLHSLQSERALYPAKDVPGITTVLESFMCHDGRRLDPRHVDPTEREKRVLSVASTGSHSVPRETVDGGGAGRVAGATSITPPIPTSSFPNAALEPEFELYKHSSEDRDLNRNSRRHWKGLPVLCVFPPTTRRRASCCSAPGVERTGPDNAMTTQAMDSMTSVLMEASSTPRSTGSVDMSMHSTPSLSSSQCSPKRGLRRTKKMPLQKRESSLSPRSCSPLRDCIDAYPMSAVETRQSHALSLTASSHDHDAPPANVRLGHPSRPYYSAIRKDMSRPTSPVFSITAPRTPSPIPSHVDYVPRGTKSLDCWGQIGHSVYTRIATHVDGHIWSNHVTVWMFA